MHSDPFFKIWLVGDTGRNWKLRRNVLGIVEMKTWTNKAQESLKLSSDSDASRFLRFAKEFIKKKTFLYKTLKTIGELY